MRDAVGAVQSVLVLGGSSDIARATVRELARTERLERAVLAGRPSPRLDEAAAEARAAGVHEVSTLGFDAADFDHHDAVVEEAWRRLGDVDVVLIAFGILGDQARAEHDRRHAIEIVETDFTAAVSIGIPVSERLRAQGHGSIVVLSSVAGERVRRSNFVYGSSKAGLDGFFSGLGDALVGTGVHVMVVRPGFVRTRMTEGMAPAPLATTSEAVARVVARGLAARREVVWAPPALRYVMSVLRHVPRPLFRRLPL